MPTERKFIYFSSQYSCKSHPPGLDRWWVFLYKNIFSTKRTLDNFNKKKCFVINIDAVNGIEPKTILNIT